jgi:hypothetical protein
MEVFHSFVGGIVSFRVLSRPQFSVLQQNLFPIYFGLQAILPVLITMTYPSPAPASVPNSFRGVLHSDNETHVLVPLALMMMAGVVNWAIVGPETTKVMRKRKHQETKDGKKYYDAGPHSEDMQKLNRRFSSLHGVSSLVNVLEIVITIWYGIGLASRL